LGTAVGALTYTALPQILLDYEDAELMLFGLGMLIVLIAFPGGLASVPDALVRVLSRLFASKRRP